MRLTKNCRGTHLSGHRVAVIGAGPAGLYAAGWLASDGCAVEVFDMLPEPGGLLVSGIPDTRLDKAALREAAREMCEAGVVLRLGVRIGQDVHLRDIIEQYDAVLITTGAWQSRRLEVPGEDLGGVHCALEYLVDYALAQHGYGRVLPDLSGRTVLVVGGGLTAVDACHVARQAGAGRVVWQYRRTRQEAPARLEEREAFDALAAQVEFCPLTQPVRFIGSGGHVEAVEAVRMRLGEPDSSGRPRPVPIEGSEFRTPVDFALVAAGEVATPPPGAVECGIRVNERPATGGDEVAIVGEIAIASSVAPEDAALQYTSVRVEQVVRARGAVAPAATIAVDGSFRTSRTGVFAAGNVIDGPTQAGYPIVEGIMAARAIAEYLHTGHWTDHGAAGVLQWRDVMFI